jgi:hypothetical protein
MSDAIMNAVLALPDSLDKRDLEWCAAIAMQTSNWPELRALNVAVFMAVRLLRERENQEKR